MNNQKIAKFAPGPRQVAASPHATPWGAPSEPVPIDRPNQNPGAARD